MSFDSATALRKATGRAKSDVANKLISMLLHEISRRACAASGQWVSDSSYAQAVSQTFGHLCIYCERILERDRAAVEHLDGMNRIRVGLHVPGNVAVSCRSCNAEKRRDDQLPKLILASSGWESFLSHDGTRCAATCKTCMYWQSVWIEPPYRQDKLQKAIETIRQFRLPYAHFISWSAQTRPAIQSKVEALYRSCQEFATTQIAELTEELVFDFTSLEKPTSR